MSVCKIWSPPYDQSITEMALRSSIRAAGQSLKSQRSYPGSFISIHSRNSNLLSACRHSNDLERWYMGTMILNKKQKLYFAAPLFSDMERRFNIELAEQLEQFFDVFLPQRDGGLMATMISE